MYRLSSILIGLLFALLLLICLPRTSSAQQMTDSVVAEHVRLRLPLEREWLGREVITELERSWKFVNGATGEKLPRRVFITILWNQDLVRVDPEQAAIVLGMDHPAAASNPRQFLIRSATREMSRLGLLELSRGTTQREANQFLIEGMSEILSCEFERNTRGLTGAWVIAHFLDKLNLLGFPVQTAWSKGFDGRHTLRSAAPGATFLMACREIHGRERTAKLFEALKKGSLEDALASAFRTSAAALESAWLERVRSYNVSEDLTASGEDEAPALQQIAFEPAEGRPGNVLQIRLSLKDSGGNLFPESVFVQDEASGRVFQAKAPSEKGAGYFAVNVPIEAGHKPGKYNFRVTAVDEAGNCRHWTAAYSVGT